MMVHDFACIGKLSPNCSLPATLGIDFNDSLQPAVLEIVSSAGIIHYHKLLSLIILQLLPGTTTVSVKPIVGELLRPVTIPEHIYEQEESKLRGMNEHSATVDGIELNNIAQKVLEIANLGICQSRDNCLR